MKKTSLKNLKRNSFNFSNKHLNNERKAKKKETKKKRKLKVYFFNKPKTIIKAIKPKKVIWLSPKTTNPV